MVHFYDGKCHNKFLYHSGFQKLLERLKYIKYNAGPANCGVRRVYMCNLVTRVMWYLLTLQNFLLLTYISSSGSQLK
jgi:hypothetical protein